MRSYLSTMTISKLQNQVCVRSCFKYCYIWLDFSVLAQKRQLILNRHLKNYVACLEGIFFLMMFSYFFKVFNLVNTGNISQEEKFAISISWSAEFTTLISRSPICISLILINEVGKYLNCNNV